MFYARSVYMTMLVELSTLSLVQANGTEAMTDAMVKFFNYCETHMETVVRYKARDMIISIHSDVSYLYEPESCSRFGGYFFMKNKPK